MPGVRLVTPVSAIFLLGPAPTAFWMRRRSPPGRYLSRSYLSRSSTIITAAQEGIVPNHPNAA